MAEVIITRNWSRHAHIFTKSSLTENPDIRIEINHCTICDQHSEESGIPISDIDKHPKGCQCYWCVYAKSGDKNQNPIKPESTNPAVLYKTCDHCGGAGRLNIGAGKPKFAALTWLEDHEETCNSCNGSGKVRSN